MDEIPDTAAFTVEVGQSRAEYVRQVLGTAARATLAASRANNFEFRNRVAEPLSAPERWPRERPLSSRGRTQPATPAAPAPPPPPHTSVPNWAEDRDAVLDALRSLCEMCETLHQRIAEIQKWPAHALYREMAKWRDEKCAHIAEESQKREQEPLELPSLRSLRQ